MNLSKKVFFIRGDLNSLQGGVIPLRNKIWIDLIVKNYGPIYDGLKIWLYEDTKNQGRRDPTIFPGLIKMSKIDNEYEIFVDEKKMQYLSESPIFKDYSINDVIYFK